MAFQNKFFLWLSSLRITVAGLILLFILTFWGTVAQVDNGLYASQQRYFNSFYFLVLGFIPFPGAQLVLWMLFVNLFCAFVNRIVYTWKNIGLIFVHCGLVLFFVSAFLTFYNAKESYLTLREGQTADALTDVRLTNKSFPLPIAIKLIDFMLENHPGTDTARSYKSIVEIQHDAVKRKVIISMNNPLRFKDYTFYQSSYHIDSKGHEFSTFTVVKNPWRFLPYIAAFVTSLGLALHFILAAFNLQWARK